MIFGALNINPWICSVCNLTNFIHNKKCADWKCQTNRPNTMNHKFSSSILDSEKCKICKRPEKDHGPDAECEVCSKKDDCLDVNGILMCQSCLEKELNQGKQEYDVQEAWRKQTMYKTSEDQSNPIQKLADQVRDMDSKISSKPEFFNAETMAIEEIKAKILADSSITNKRFELAKIVQQRVMDFEKALFHANQVRFELNDRQQANRVYLQNLATQLTTEEREKVRLKDINYPVNQPSLKTPRAPSTKAKTDRDALREAAAKYSINASAIQTVCIARNLSVDAAIELMKKTGMIKAVP
jgi:hypothetical protein